MRAIDLYAGVGGWSLGLKLAGIDVVASYDRFEPANITNRLNNRHPVICADIRQLDLNLIPKNIDIVVGSPPCKEFSYSNKGGGGDIEDGLRDIVAFLRIVDYLKPTYWVMENVPRLNALLSDGFKPGGFLEKYLHLDPKVQTVNMESFGLPQRRKRCLAGNINFEKLNAYATGKASPTLGKIINALDSAEVTDPNYGIKLPRENVSDHILEDPLNEEEFRVNWAAKTMHPVYNKMQFPDSLDQPSRTVTSTYTRVSRESIVVKDGRFHDKVRRLTLRERACLQSFPIHFQFFGDIYRQKGTMIGNAVPPLISYYVGLSCLPRNLEQSPDIAEHIRRFVAPDTVANSSAPNILSNKFARNRTFRFAIPGLNLRSGVRFELSNSKDGCIPIWNVAFYFGTSKNIKSISLGIATFDLIDSLLPQYVSKNLEIDVSDVRSYVSKADIKRMHGVWTRSHPGLTRPLDFLDGLSSLCQNICECLSPLNNRQSELIIDKMLWQEFSEDICSLPGVAKLKKNSKIVIAGAILGSLLNDMLITCEPAQQEEDQFAFA